MQVDLSPVDYVEYSVLIEQGITLVFDVVDDDTGEAVDLTGYTGKLDAKRKRGDASPLFSLTFTNLNTTATGRIQFAITASDLKTALGSRDPVEYDLWLKNTDNQWKRMQYGRFTFESAISILS